LHTELTDRLYVRLGVICPMTKIKAFPMPNAQRVKTTMKVTSKYIFYINY